MKSSKVRQTLLSIAIALVFSMLIGYGISALYPEPELENCNYNIHTKTECEASNGKWESFDNSRTQFICDKVEGDDITLQCTENSIEFNGHCENSCYDEYREKMEAYNKTVFIIATLIGLVGIFVGGVLISVESVGTGLMGGSILTFLYGTLRYWESASEILRVLILAISLIAMIWLGYTKMKS